MSFAQPFSESHAIQEAIQKHKTDGMSDGSSSPIRDGAEDPGVTVAHPSATLHLRRTKDHAAHPGLRRKYADTGSGGGKS